MVIEVIVKSVIVLVAFKVLKFNRGFLVSQRLWKINKWLYYFFKGHGNESYNLIGSSLGQYFPVSGHVQR